MDHTTHFQVSPEQQELLDQAATKLGASDASDAVEQLVKQKLIDIARRVSKDGRGKAMYRPPARYH